MSNPSKPTSSSPLPGDDRNVVASGTAGAEASFDEQLHAFWLKNRKTILLFVAVGVLAILGREAVQLMWKQREQGISRDYAAAEGATALKAFAAEHSAHPLAGIALLRVADEAYEARNYSEAAAAYEQAVAPLKDTPMAARARLGAAICQAAGADRAKGEAALKVLADDMTIMAGQRTEARYYLATLAIADGRIAEARQTLTDIATTDLTGMWAQRAFMLSASLPPEGGVATPAATSTPAAPAAGEVPEIKLNLPGSTP